MYKIILTLNLPTTNQLTSYQKSDRLVKKGDAHFVKELYLRTIIS